MLYLDPTCTVCKISKSQNISGENSKSKNKCGKNSKSQIRSYPLVVRSQLRFLCLEMLKDNLNVRLGRC